MRIGIVLPGFSADADDWAIPVQQHLARELAKTDDVRIIALRYPHRTEPYMVEGAAVHPLGAGAAARGLARIALWRRALRLITKLHGEVPFDVLHAMWADETGLIAGRAGRRLGVPMIVSILGGELVGMHEIGYGLQRSRFSRWIVGRALGGADRVIAASSYVRGLISQAGYDVPDEKIITEVLGVETTLFRPDAQAGDPCKLINVASLVPVKDQAMLLRALARLDARVTLDVIGVGTEQAALERLAHELGITRRVRFLGAVKHLDLPAYYQRAGIKVLTSRHEILAMSTLEAAACALPVISTAVGTLPDYPSIGVTVPVGDDAALAAAIQGLVDNPKRRAALGISARATVEREFDVRGSAETLRRLYGDVIDDRERRKSLKASD